MKEQLSPSPSPEQNKDKGLRLSALSFLTNGPYSMVIQPGECVGLTGRSGIGKTQLLRALADVIVHEGSCSLDGQLCDAFSPPDWRKTVAMVPAESFWWFDRVAAHFQKGEDLAGDTRLLERLGFASDVLDWQVSRLSTGERQRLALFRTLITEPQVLLLDEPTSALDQKMTQVVEEVVMEKCSSRKTACLWVSHDQEQLFRVAERVFRVEVKGLVSVR
jgi:UDP-glucose/iron transport system ATP-binding protein